MNASRRIEWYNQGRTILALWVGALAPPFIWGVHLSLIYLFATVLCGPRLHAWLYSVTAAALLMDGAAGYIAWRCYRVTLGEPKNAGPEVVRTRFFGATGMLAAALFAVAILAQTVPMLVYQSC